MSEQASQARIARRMRANLAAKAAMDEVRALGAVPEGCGPEIPVAPARGPVVQFTPMKAYPDGENGHKFKPSGHLGRKALRHADAFDLMANRAAGKGKPPPFTPAQVAMARDYAALYEKHQCAGVRCSSMEAAPDGGGGGGGEYIDAVLRDAERLAVIQRRIGNGVAMAIRRKRAGDQRVVISDRKLVDAVCIEGQTISAVMLKHGWKPRGKSVVSLIEALGAALDRMAGPVRSPRVASVTYGQQAVMRG